MKKYCLLVIILMAQCLFANNQLLYLTHPKASLSFAQLYLGMDAQFIPNSGAIPKISGESFSFNSGTIPRFTIGGLHFWGHADFYVTFPFSANTTSSGTSSGSLSTGIETGAKYYPMQLKPYHLSPFIGISWLIMQYQQDTQAGSGPSTSFNRFPLLVGVSYPVSAGIFELGVGWIDDNELSYPLSTSDRGIVTLPSIFTWFGFNYTIETTQKSDVFTGDINNAWMLSVGPSSAYQLSTSSYNDTNRDYLNETKGLALFPEFGVGYYWYDIDAAINVAYRDITFEDSAYGTTQIRNRQSISLEGVKFLFDYHGFVPFIGASLSSDTLRVTDSSALLDISANKLRLGLIFGWDIRPFRNPVMLLRTNLRYYPNTTLNASSTESFAFDQLEFNFIEAVIYPERLMSFINK